MTHSAFKKNPPAAAALYIHVPLCRSKCRYCDFYSRPESPETARRYVRAARLELAAANALLRIPAGSVFVGGGTPTALAAEQLTALLSSVDCFVGAGTEFTVEANPSTVTPRKAALLTGSGVNRVSLGAQSFHLGELATLGRRHAPEATGRAIGHLRAEGIDNISIDLIYGIAGQTIHTWRETLRRAIGLGIEHLSCYALTVEPDTPLGRDVARGIVGQVDDSLQRDMYDAARHDAAAGGLEHYEISNFARPGRQCRHNLVYWRNDPYVGIGPAAASYIGGVRSTNSPDLTGYMAAVEAGQRPGHSSERLTGRFQMAEAVMLSMRMIRGIDRRAFASRYGSDPLEVFPHTLKRYEAIGAVRISPTHVRLSDNALFTSDTVLADVLAEA